MMRAWTMCPWPMLVRPWAAKTEGGLSRQLLAETWVDAITTITMHVSPTDVQVTLYNSKNFKQTS